VQTDSILFVAEGAIVETFLLMLTVKGSMIHCLF